MRIISILLLLFTTITSFAQQDTIVITGIVIGHNSDGTKSALAGANLRWGSTFTGTTTDEAGEFILHKTNATDTLIVSYVNFNNDTIIIDDQLYLQIELHSGQNLQGADIVYKQKATRVNLKGIGQIETMGEMELGKAACCALSESFETNPTVDVSFTDAISGTRQIRMLGLAGTYSQLTKENMPDIRGLAAINGMEFIPGTWIESIQLIQGAGSVANGFESIAGQINTELHKPNTTKNYLNLYFNSDRSMEANAHIKYHIGKNWFSNILLHGKINSYKHDRNNDGFLDMPLNKRIVLLNRYEWKNTHNIHFEFGGRLIYLDQIGGQTSFDKNQTMDSLHPWGLLNNITKADGWLKLGKVNRLKPWQSTAIQLSGSIYNQNARYGLNQYQGIENTFYANILHQGRIANARHEYRIGFSYLFDNYNETLNSKQYLRKESIPGTFAEYTYKPNHKFGIVTGLRLDIHNYYGAFVTPRIHMRYELTEKTTLRASAGKGYRTANILAEHLSVLASSRELIIHSNGDYGFGLNQESAWNYGLSITNKFEAFYREGSISTTFYRTDFINQIVFDMEQSPNEVHFYNLKGQSYANSFQFKIDYELLKRLDVRIAYRYYDVKSTYGDELKQAPLLSPHRGFLNIAYNSRKHWKFDATLNIQGSKRIPSIEAENQIYSRPETSPVFGLVNTQISKKWNEKFEVYLGGENILNYKQQDPIISAENPYGPFFDASLIWGPVFGIKVYAGLRLTIL
jgi:outer membrane cobalamin receptor